MVILSFRNVYDNSFRNFYDTSFRNDYGQPPQHLRNVGVKMFVQATEASRRQNIRSGDRG